MIWEVNSAFNEYRKVFRKFEDKRNLKFNIFSLLSFRDMVMNDDREFDQINNYEMSIPGRKSPRIFCRRGRLLQRHFLSLCKYTSQSITTISWLVLFVVQLMLFKLFRALASIDQFLSLWINNGDRRCSMNLSWRPVVAFVPTFSCFILCQCRMCEETLFPQAIKAEAQSLIRIGPILKRCDVESRYHRGSNRRKFPSYTRLYSITFQYLHYYADRPWINYLIEHQAWRKFLP